MSFLHGTFRLLLLFFAGAAPVFLLLLLLQLSDGFVRGSVRSPLAFPMLSLPPHWATVNTAPLALVHICAHGTGEGETKARGRLLLVGTTEVHGKDVLGQSKGHMLAALIMRERLMHGYYSII